MKRRHVTWAGAILAVAATAAAAQTAAPPATWQEANKRSAALIKERGPNTEAADLARAAFDLYPQQTRSYSDKAHAQLLLNLLDARKQADGKSAALRELDQTVVALSRRAGESSAALIDVWKECGAIASRGTEEAGRCHEQAFFVAERALGPEHPDTIRLLLESIHDLRAKRGYEWALGKYRMARERAQKIAPDGILVTQIDVSLAKLDMEAGKEQSASDGYRAVIDRLERRSDREQELLLQFAYAQLERVYEERGLAEKAEDIRRRRNERLAAKDDQLVPLARVAPTYPRAAAQSKREGVVDLYLKIAADGTVTSAKVIRSDPPGVFDEAALAAIREWKFRPKVVAGEPVESAGTQRIEFKMR